jgi:tetratricopeptide (TPR) repeat protein
MSLRSYSIALVVLLMLGTRASWAQFKLYEKGHDSYTAGKYEDAIKNFTDFLGKATHDKATEVDVYYLRALSYYKLRDYKNAIPDFEETLLRNHTNKGNIYWFMAKSYEAQAQYNEAIEHYSNAIRDLDANADTKAKLLYERSQAYTRAGNLTLAYEDLRNGSKLQPGNSDIKREFDKLEKQGVASRSTNDAQAKQPAGNKIQSAPTTTAAATTNPPQDDLIASRLNQKRSDAGTTPPPANTNHVEKTQVVTPDASRVEVGKTVAEIVNPLADNYKDEKRYALVIGNSKYPAAIGVLRNPVNDATEMAKELQRSNFEVQLLTDATYGQMRAAMLKFKEKVDAGEKDKTVALFYYAGHGLAHDDENYLVPIDAMVEFEDDIARYCFGVQRMVLANMERSNSRMNIIILDACRNNPFPALTRSAGQQGLGEMKRARGSFIAYATAPGSVASDGTGKNGLYTQELLKAMRKPGLTIEQVFKEVRGNVSRMSDHKQDTWDSSNIIGDFYFKF